MLSYCSYVEQKWKQLILRIRVGFALNIIFFFSALLSWSLYENAVCACARLRLLLCSCVLQRFGARFNVIIDLVQYMLFFSLTLLISFKKIVNASRPVERICSYLKQTRHISESHWRATRTITIVYRILHSHFILSFILLFLVFLFEAMFEKFRFTSCSHTPEKENQTEKSSMLCWNPYRILKSVSLC